MSIKTNFEFPRAEDPNDVVKQGQRLAQDLSKNFKSIKNKLDKLSITTTSTPYGLDGLEFSGSFSIFMPAGSGTRFQVFTFTHNFGSIPTGFLITDLTSSNSSILTSPIATRDSWTTTQITIRIAITTLDFGTDRTQTGTFKILVLR